MVRRKRIEVEVKRKLLSRKKAPKIKTNVKYSANKSKRRKTKWRQPNTTKECKGILNFCLYQTGLRLKLISN